MSVAVITGSAGLVGSEAARHFAALGMHVVGIDNDMRARFFGAEASTEWRRRQIQEELGSSYEHFSLDIRDDAAMDRLFSKFGSSIELIVHAASQPSHDWAAREPLTDFSVNATGTAILLETTRKTCPNAVFIFLSTNKVYGDTPNRLPLLELETRWEIDPQHRYASGIGEDMPIDRSLHSLFGVSKLSADLLVQEYGRYFGLATASFRGGCLTGPAHSAARLHGFLAYLMKCTATGTLYTVFGYKGKQVRDNIHSSDLIRAFEAFFRNPKRAAVYNIGGGRFSNCSMLEAISFCQEISGRELDWRLVDENRVGDHMWWISDNASFQADFPDWQMTKNVPQILREIFEENRERWNHKVAEDV